MKRGRSASKRAAKKTTAKTTEKVPQSHGGALNAGGTPGNAGGGRPQKAFKDFLSELRKDPEVQDALARAAKDETSTSFRAAHSIMAQYDTEKPAERKVIQLDGPQGISEAFNLIRDRIRAKLAPDVAADLIADIHRTLEGAKL